MKLTQNLYRFTLATILCFGLSYAFHRANPVSSTEGHGFPLSVLIRIHEASGPQSADIEDRFETSGHDVGKISVHSVNLDVRIVPSVGEKIEITLNGRGTRSSQETPLIRHEMEGEELILRSANESDSISGTLTLHVPAKIKRLEIQSVSGDLSGDLGRLDQLSLQTISGDVDLHSKEIAELNLKTTSGDAALSGKIDRIHAVSVSGDLRFSLPTNAGINLSFSTVSGERNVSDTLKLKPSGTPVSVKTVSGDLTLE